jgi:hypothetical protein
MHFFFFYKFEYLDFLGRCAKCDYFDPKKIESAMFVRPMNPRNSLGLDASL